MGSYKTVVRPGGTGPLDQIDAYVDDSGKVHHPGEEGYVERPASEGEVEPANAEADTPLDIADKAGDAVTRGQVESHDRERAEPAERQAESENR